MIFSVDRFMLWCLSYPLFYHKVQSISIPSGKCKYACMYLNLIISFSFALLIQIPCSSNPSSHSKVYAMYMSIDGLIYWERWCMDVTLCSPLLFNLSGSLTMFCRTFLMLFIRQNSCVLTSVPLLTVLVMKLGSSIIFCHSAWHGLEVQEQLCLVWVVEF